MRENIRRQLMAQGRKLGLVGAGLLAVVNNAMAALPAEATAAFTSLTGNVTDILSAVWPIVGAVVGGFALIKLFKKGASRAV